MYIQSVHHREHDVQFFSIKVLLPIKYIYIYISFERLDVFVSCTVCINVTVNSFLAMYCILLWKTCTYNYFVVILAFPCVGS